MPLVSPFLPIIASTLPTVVGCDATFTRPSIRHHRWHSPFFFPPLSFHIHRSFSFHTIISNVILSLSILIPSLEKIRQGEGISCRCTKAISTPSRELEIRFDRRSISRWRETPVKNRWKLKINRAPYLHCCLPLPRTRQIDPRATAEPTRPITIITGRWR